MQTKATLEKHVEDLKAEILLLWTRPQRMDVALLNNSQMDTYTGLNPKASRVGKRRVGRVHAYPLIA